MFEERHMVLDVQYTTRQHPLQDGCRHSQIAMQLRGKQVFQTGDVDQKSILF
jgi:hypothetical protein